VKTLLRKMRSIEEDPPISNHCRYVDGEIVRQGVVGDHGDGAYSTGRGGKQIHSRHSPLSFLGVIF